MDYLIGKQKIYESDFYPYGDGIITLPHRIRAYTSFPQLFYPLMTRQFFCDFHEKSEDFCVS